MKSTEKLLVSHDGIFFLYLRLPDLEGEKRRLVKTEFRINNDFFFWYKYVPCKTWDILIPKKSLGTLNSVFNWAFCILSGKLTSFQKFMVFYNIVYRKVGKPYSIFCRYRYILFLNIILFREGNVEVNFCKKILYLAQYRQVLSM